MSKVDIFLEDFKFSHNVSHLMFWMILINLGRFLKIEIRVGTSGSWVRNNLPRFSWFNLILSNSISMKPP